MSYLSEIYTIPVVKRYVSTTLSMSNFIRINFKLISFFLPLIISFSSFGFWLKVNFFKEQPKLKFTKEYMISLDYNDKKIFWSSFQNYNELYKNNLVIPSLNFIEMDSNFDKIMDSIQIDMTFDNVTKNNNTIGRIFFGFLFETILDYRINWKFKTFVMGEYFLLKNGPINQINCFGDLYLESINEYIDMNDMNKNINITQNILNTTDISIDLFYKYIRDIKYSLEGRKFICNTMYNINSTSTNLSFSYKIPEQIIFYKTSIFELIKWGLIQYITFAILIRSFLNQFLKFLCINNCLDTWIDK
ncbi:Transmembrane protein 231 [Strongyloides ratti]|uniref:Transmembrane protein 231 n=1 Tax=Strongyloides ratti TaxID=34506 RepID=A0A090LV22_STRRB|nr:Transmembrane protein 231 [Strongyloides ratti]CEF71509.1 Transmembrane protein 231 [Strongyloides ratti]